MQIQFPHLYPVLPRVGTLPISLFVIVLNLGFTLSLQDLFRDVVYLDDGIWREAATAGG
jgi:hypothetical protein